MLVKFLNRFKGTAARPVVMMVVLAILVLSTVNIGYTEVSAQVVGVVSAATLPTLSASTQFDLTGFLQSATLDCATYPSVSGDPARCGGTLMVNGQTVVVPAETVVILPASALTWQELFAQSPAPYTGIATGMAVNDIPTPPYSTYEFNVIGNRVISGGQDRYIAGLIHVTQQGLNAGAGYINYIDYTTGEFEVGGLLNVQGTGARVRINDPIAAGTDPNFPATGRYTRGAVSPDGRFQVDQDNPTIASATGFPMCIPRVTADPNIAGNADDPQCPLGNRPISTGLKDPITGQQHPPAGEFDSFFTMNVPGAGLPDPTIQAPMEVGDYVNYAGTLIQLAGGDYISAHTVVNNTAIFTQPGVDPAYVSIEVSLIGTGGLTIFGAGEATARTRFEGMTTDPSRLIHLYGIDINPLTGATIDRDWGRVGVDPGPPLLGAVKGRWRFRPPCTATLGTETSKDCSPPPAGTFLPPTREVRAVIEGLQSQDPQNAAAIKTANGIFYGQYHAPIGEYIFPENVPGQPIPENNFNELNFLAQGGYSSFTGVRVGVLNPWPSNVLPVPTCVAPTANAGGPYTVASGGTVTLSGTSTGTSPSFTWAAPAKGSLSSLSIANPVYTAPLVAANTVVNLSLTATNGCGTNTATTTVTVNAALAPTVDPIAPQTVTSGDPGTFAVTASDPNVPAATPLTFTVTQTGTPALINLKVTQNGATGANVDYTSPSSLTVPDVVTVTVTAKNAAGVSSAPVSTTVTVNPAVTGTAPVANAGGPYTVGSGGSVTLAGSATGSPTLNFAWTVSAGSLSGANTATPVYTAPVVSVATNVTVTLTVTNNFGSSTATSTIAVGATLAPVINPVAIQNVFSGANGSFTVSGSDPNNPARLPLTYTVTQTGTPSLLNLKVQTVNPTSATISFTAPTLPLGQVVNSVVTLTITATNTGGKSSSVTTTVNITPLPDVVAITNAEYRTGKVRLILTASSSVVSPNVILTLQPYVCATAQPAGVPPCPGGVFDPSTLGNTFTNTGGGLYTLTLVGAPEPAIPPATPLTAKSNLNGVSAPHGLDRIRQ